MIKEIIERKREEVDEIKKIYNDFYESAKEEINWKYELRRPLFEKDNLVEFDFDNGNKKIRCKGIIAGTDIYRVHGKIEEIEYDICGKDYETFREKCLYKGDKDRFAKKLANRRIRRRTKRNPYDSLTGKSNHYRKENESWDICDYRHWGELIWREESCLNLRDYPNLWQKCYRRK